MKKPEAKPQGSKTSTTGTAQGTALGKIEPVKAPATAIPAKALATPKKPFNPAKFFTEVRQEARRITWTSRKETWITTVMVLIMVLVATLFFFVVDGALGYATSMLTKIGQA